MKVLITGGSRGIGKAMTDHLRAGGHDVRSLGRGIGNDYHCDLQNRHDRAAFMAGFTGYVDVLINNAGFQHIEKASTYPLHMWDAQMEMLTAAFELSHWAYGGGAKRIINIASDAGIRGTRGCVGYSVAKAALIHLTRCLSNEWAEHGCTVNAIAPGYVETDMLKSAFRDEAHKAQIAKLIPAGRIGAPADLLPAVDYLLAAEYVTGTVLVVDGGWLAR